MSQEKKLLSRRRILSNGVLAGVGMLGVGGLLASNHLMAPTAQAAASATTTITKWSITCNNSYTGTMMFPARFSYSSFLTDNSNSVYLGTAFQDAMFFVKSATDAKVSFLQLKDPAFNSFDLYVGTRSKDNLSMGGEFVQISRPYGGAAYKVSLPYDWFASRQNSGGYTYYSGAYPQLDKYEKDATQNYQVGRLRLESYQWGRLSGQKYITGFDHQNRNPLVGSRIPNGPDTQFISFFVPTSTHLFQFKVFAGTLDSYSDNIDGYYNVVTYNPFKHSISTSPSRFWYTTRANT
jgi:hypothetical protein